nr:helix-turn-helix domain-containing protein [Haloactinospora alba]
MRKNDRLMTVSEVLAELGGVPRRTFYRWREVGHAPCGIKLPNGELRFWKSDVEAWLLTLREDAA